MTYLAVLVFAVAFAGLAMTVNEGLWNNMISLMSIILCGPLAIALGYPLGLIMQAKLEKPVEQTWYFVFAGVWLVFFVSIMVVRLIADRVASKTRMKFVPPLEMAGGPIVGLLVAGLFASFLAFTLRTIPIESDEYWKKTELTGWKATALTSGAAPFNTVLKAMAGAEVAKYHLLN